MLGLEKRKAELEAVLSKAGEPPPSLHPEMASHYRRQVDELYRVLQEDNGPAQLKAVEALRSLIAEIVLSPHDGKLTIDVLGDLAGILTIAAGKGQTRSALRRKNATEVDDILSQVEVVAGAGFEPAAFRL